MNEIGPLTMLQARAGEAVTPAPDADDLVVLPSDLDDGRHVLGRVRRHNDVRVDVVAEAVVNCPPLFIAVAAFGKNFAADGALQQVHQVQVGPVATGCSG